MEEILKSIRTKGYEFYYKTGRMPKQILINNKDFDNLAYCSKEVRTCEDGKTYFEDVEIVIVRDIKELEIR